MVNWEINEDFSITNLTASEDYTINHALQIMNFSFIAYSKVKMDCNEVKPHEVILLFDDGSFVPMYCSHYYAED